MSNQKQSIGGEPRTLRELMEALGVDIPLHAVLTPEEREAVNERRRAEDEQRINRDLKAHRARVMRQAATCVPPKLRALVARPFKRTRAVELAMEWEASNKHRGLILRGGTGVGKSFASAAALMRSLRRWKLSVSWHRPNDFVSAVLHRYDPNAPRLGEHLVVIDDVGRETKEDFQEAFTTFLDDSEARFIVSTNLTAAEFEDRYKGRLFNRLEECAVGFSVKGDSMRTGGGGL